MSSFIDLDSLHRDRVAYPNPCDYELTPSQVTTWFRSAREVRATAPNANTRPVEFVTEISIVHFTMPYDEDLAALPRLYIDFHARQYNDQYLVNTISGIHPGARFVAVPCRIQTDSDTVPVWIHYSCNMKQTLRFKRDDSVVLRITTRSGSVLTTFVAENPTDPADPLKQTLITLELLPLLRDADKNATDLASGV